MKIKNIQDIGKKMFKMDIVYKFGMKLKENINIYLIDILENGKTEKETNMEFTDPTFLFEKLLNMKGLYDAIPKMQEINLRAIKTYCARNLADFQQPHKIFIVDKLPKNTMGKLQRMAILDYVRESGLDQ